MATQTVMELFKVCRQILGVVFKMFVALGDVGSFLYVLVLLGFVPESRTQGWW